MNMYTILQKIENKLIQQKTHYTPEQRFKGDEGKLYKKTHYTPEQRFKGDEGKLYLKNPSFYDTLIQKNYIISSL